MNGGSKKDGSNDPFNDGFCLGHSMRQDAERFRSMKTAIGQLGGRPPKEPQQVTTDEPNGNQQVTTGEPNPNPSLKPLIFKLLSRKPLNHPPAPLPGLDLVPEKKPSRKEKKIQKLAPYRDDVVAMALAWEDRWPVARAGKKIRNDVVAVASLVEGILSRDPELDLATLDEAVSEWLKDPGDYPNAMEFWFGPGKNGISPPWERAVRGVLTRRKRLSNGG
jgi:hypothetical protein